MNESDPLSDDGLDERTDDAEVPQRRLLDVTALVAGVAVLAFCAAVTFGDLDTVDDQFRVVWPLVLGAIGIGLLAGVRRR